MAAILCLHAVVWTALPTLLYANLPLDLIEALTYGREWQLGYDKLPPLPWWLVEIVHRLVGHDFAYYLLAQIAIVAALWLIWVTARPLVGPVGALVAVLIVDGLHYLNYTSAKFNHDVVQLPFWALAGFAFHRALRGGWIGHWLCLASQSECRSGRNTSWWCSPRPSHYSSSTTRQARKVLATPGPYIAVAIALVTMAPHIVWLVQNNFLPFTYAEHRALPSRGLIDHIWHPAAIRDWSGVLSNSVVADFASAVLPAPTAQRDRAWCRHFRPSHCRLACLWAIRNGRGPVSDQRPWHGCDVGLSALAFPRAMDRDVRATHA